jgi:hypothetical protein
VNRGASPDREGGRIFDAKVAVMISSMEHHAEEEETALFPEAERILGARKLEEIGALIEQRRGELVGSR